jgi:hypothetical protein
MTSTEFLTSLKDALDKRQAWFENTDLPKLKTELRAFHVAVSSLYSFFAQKGHITEDPYKNDNRISSICVPDASPFPENNKREQLGLRLSNLDNQLDFLCNFYEFNIGSFSQDKIKIILGLVRYVDWVRITPESPSAITKALSEIVTQARRAVLSDPVSAKILTESLLALERNTPIIVNHLKVISDFNRELYKYDIRAGATATLPATDATIANIKKRFTSAFPSTPFYQELAEEVIKEDFSKNSDALQEAILKKLSVSGDKTKTEAQPVSIKPILIEGLNAIGACGLTLSEIYAKIQGNHEVMENQQKGFIVKIRKLFAQMSSKEPEPVIYELEYVDPVKGTIVKEKINFKVFSLETEKRTQILQALAFRGSAAKKLEAMEEKHLVEILQQNIKTVQKLFNTIGGMDEYFKKEVSKELRVKIKGVKPELSALKNGMSKANQKLHEYLQAKEEEEQFKRLGINAAN